jgi:AraC-like DNA-binding protein
MPVQVVLWPKGVNFVHDMSPRPAIRSAAVRSTTLSSWVAAVKRALEAKGLDAVGMMREAGLDPALLDDPLARYPAGRALDFWAHALHESNDPLLGLHVSRYVTPSTFHALGYAQLASSNLAELFERAARYFRVVTEAGEVTFVRERGYGRLTLRGEPALLKGDGLAVACCVLDCFILTILKACGMLLGQQFKLVELRLQRPAPVDRATYERLFRQVPVYGCDDNTLVMSDDVLLTPLPTANAMLARLNEDATAKYLADLDGDAFLSRVKRLIQDQLPGGDPSQEDVAARLSLTTRSLQRRLVDSGTTYREVINDLRQHLAMEYLSQGVYSVSEVAYLLGFAEVSAFTRAFRRWTGASPSAWRQQVP